MSSFSLIETMRWEPAVGIVRLRLHLARLKRSAARLGFPGAGQAEQRLAAAFVDTSPLSALRVRLALDSTGRIDIATTPFTPLPADPLWTVRIATTRLSSGDNLLRYKTSRRAVYEAARAEYGPDEADEVLLLNERDEPCEGTITSLFVDDGSGMLKTQPISCGLLAGVLRTEMICQRKARVQRLTLDDLKSRPVFIGNSLRGLIRANILWRD
ncbi:aminotransferase class IV family protein [Pararhizobium antarcticum]|uniref:Probable branched-chain-amino-acid aminotransferase n=1 Tax=Pararhizobium antarcticum TaxID=1798805 RepID=A0A657LR46_9HYPH|nr:aminotransferase class IV family protein [Pararhizobium antarcticum]OJF94517.1 hypothetical protein AX760_19900 [Pararhizobium antarcticum]OJF96657.1 hypothetical protein AX761_03580 [Rhizobium sp. 58]